MSVAEANQNGVGQPLKVTAEQLGIQQGDAYAGQLDYDLGNLLAFDPSPINQEEYAPIYRDAKCLEVATAMTQALVSQLFALPRAAVQGGRLAHLPAPSTPLPREKPIPKPKPLTKWQKFAQEKGIRKRKRSKLVFDEDAQEWRRRHGYKKANDAEAVPVIEAKATDMPGEDPFTQLRKEKKERQQLHSKQQLANVKQAIKQGGAAAVPATLRLAATLPEKGRGKPIKRKELRDEIKTMSLLSGFSTASMGKFDKRLPGEKEGERKLPGKRRKFLPVAGTAAERDLISKTADKLLRERSADVLDLNKAIGRLEAEARQQRHTAKQAADGDGGGGRTRGKGKGGRSKGGKQSRAKKGAGGKLGARGGVNKTSGAAGKGDKGRGKSGKKGKR